VFLSICGLAIPQARADITWIWSYSGSGIAASGTLKTGDTPNAAGFYQILDIAGSRNGDPITGLFPTGSAIPGNEPFAVDNLIRAGGPDQLTGDGFGVTFASGAHTNPFFADFLSPPAYLEFFSSPAGTTELPVSFTAKPVPEPSSIAVLLAGLGLLAWRGRATRAQRR
jgi:hypothetical protein